MLNHQNILAVDNRDNDEGQDVLDDENNKGVDESDVERVPFLNAAIMKLIGKRIEEADKIHRVNKRNSDADGSEETKKRKYDCFQE